MVQILITLPPPSDPSKIYTDSFRCKQDQAADTEVNTFSVSYISRKVWPLKIETPRFQSLRIQRIQGQNITIFEEIVIDGSPVRGKKSIQLTFGGDGKLTKVNGNKISKKESSDERDKSEAVPDQVAQAYLQFKPAAEEKNECIIQ